MEVPRIVRFLIGAVVVLILGALSGWYFYLHSQESNAAIVTAGRGLGTTAPSFGGTTGSTQANQSFASQALGIAPYTLASASSSALWQVDAAPVAGMGFVNDASGASLNYVERGNGYVFNAHPATRSAVRVTNTLMPKVYEALVADDGSVIERSIDTNGKVTTFLGTIATSTVMATSTSSSNIAIQNESAASSTPATLAGVYLPNGIQAIALDKSDKSLFYLTPDPRGGVDGTAMQWNGTKKKQIFTSIVGSWTPTLLEDGTIVLLESPADGIPGYAYKLSASGTLTPLLRDLPGLTILPKSSSNLLLYGTSDGSGLSLFGISSSTQELSIATIADKCVWLPGASEIAYCAVPNTPIAGNYLDGWYQGSVNTSDDWWEVDLSAGTASRIFSPRSANVSLDVEDPTIDPSGNYIAFKNASDQSLWVLRVAQ